MDMGMGMGMWFLKELAVFNCLKPDNYKRSYYEELVLVHFYAEVCIRCHT